MTLPYSLFSITRTTTCEKSWIEVAVAGSGAAAPVAGPQDASRSRRVAAGRTKIQHTCLCELRKRRPVGFRYVFRSAPASGNALGLGRGSRPVEGTAAPEK